MAWIVGVYIGGLPVNTVMAGFPSQLFLTLAGVTLLFAMAQSNGTLSQLTHHAVRVCRGNAGTIPIMFFVLGAAALVDGPGQHRDRGAPDADRDGDGRARRHSAVPDGHHGRQRRQRRRALAVRADRHHRQRHHGEEPDAGPRGCRRISTTSARTR